MTYLCTNGLWNQISKVLFYRICLQMMICKSFHTCSIQYLIKSSYLLSFTHICIYYSLLLLLTTTLTFGIFYRVNISKDIYTHTSCLCEIMSDTLFKIINCEISFNSLPAIIIIFCVFISLGFKISVLCFLK